MTSYGMKGCGKRGGISSPIRKSESPSILGSWASASLLDSPATSRRSISAYNDCRRRRSIPRRGALPAAMPSVCLPPDCRLESSHRVLSVPVCSSWEADLEQRLRRAEKSLTLREQAVRMASTSHAARPFQSVSIVVYQLPELFITLSICDREGSQGTIGLEPASHPGVRGSPDPMLRPPINSAPACRRRHHTRLLARFASSDRRLNAVWAMMRML
jgi:hypothetical protein